MARPEDAPGHAGREDAVDWAGVLTFLALAYGLSWGTWLGLRAAHVLFPIRAALGMFGPAVACLLVRGPLRHEGFGDAGLGLRPADRRIGWAYLTAYLSVPLLIFAGIALALLTHTQHWALEQNLHDLGRSLAALSKSGAAPHPPRARLPLTGPVLVLEAALALTLGPPINALFALGEELGWRGYLLPRLAARGESQAALAVGVVWGLWHAPLILFDGFNYPGHPWAGVGMMVVVTVPLSVIFCWLRLRSGSVWPAALAHGALNAQAGFGLLLLSSADSLIRPPLGVIGVIPFAAFAAWLVWTRRMRHAGTAT